jgi:hypothetical protein
MSQKMISCTKSKFHGFYASDTECPWCDKKQQDETVKTNEQSDKSNVDYGLGKGRFWKIPYPQGYLQGKKDTPAVEYPNICWYKPGDRKNPHHTTGKDHTLVPPARELTDKSVD